MMTYFDLLPTYLFDKIKYLACMMELKEKVVVFDEDEYMCLYSSIKSIYNANKFNELTGADLESFEKYFEQSTCVAKLTFDHTMQTFENIVESYGHYGYDILYKLADMLARWNPRKVYIVGFWDSEQEVFKRGFDSDNGDYYDRSMRPTVKGSKRRPFSQERWNEFVSDNDV